MKFLSVFMFLVVSCFVAPQLIGAVMPFRSGDILAAELSFAPLEIQSYNVKDTGFSKPCYAKMIVKISSGRTISKYDYYLELFGQKYPCVAIQRGNNSINSLNREFYNLKSTERIGLIFVLNGDVAGIDKIEKIRLKSNAQGNYPALTVPFLNLQNQKLSNNASAPLEGKFIIE